MERKIIPVLFEIICPDEEGIFIKAKEASLRDKIIGSLLGERQEKVAYLQQVQVDKPYRRCGIGSQMIEIFKGMVGSRPINGILLPEDFGIQSIDLAEFYRRNDIFSEGKYRGQIRA